MGSEKQGLKKILAFLRRLGLVASSRRSDKERAERDEGQRVWNTNAKFAFQEHDFVQVYGQLGIGARRGVVVVVVSWLAATGVAELHPQTTLTSRRLKIGMPSLCRVCAFV